MSKKLKITLEINVIDLPDEDMEMVIGSGMFNNASEVPSLSEYEGHEGAVEIAEAFCDGISPYSVAECFAGSDVYVTFESARVVNANWDDDAS
jgi:hypothetical protein